MADRSVSAARPVTTCSVGTLGGGEAVRKLFALFVGVSLAVVVAGGCKKGGASGEEVVGPQGAEFKAKVAGKGTGGMAPFTKQGAKTADEPAKGQG